MPRGVYSRKNPGKRKASTVTLNDLSSESFQPSDRQQQWSLPPYTTKSMTSGGVGSMSLTPDERKQEGDEAYDLLIDKLSCGKGYHDETTLLSRGNTFVYTFLISLTFNVWFCTQSAIARAEYRKKCRFTFELMLGWLVRLYNSHCWVFPIVLVSLWALKCRVPKPFWNFLSRSRLLYTKETTENIALDLGNRVQSPFYFPEWASRRIAIAVFDNCLVKFDTSYEGVRADGDGSRQYSFINWLSSYIHQGDVPTIIDPGGIR